jgi:hypothetical protein
MNGHIICVGSATKVIRDMAYLRPENARRRGVFVLDSHAEIVARRLFLLWLYEEILKVQGNPTGAAARSAFVEICHDGLGSSLKHAYRANLFINSAPCGDARAFQVIRSSFGDANNRFVPGQLHIKSHHDPDRFLQGHDRRIEADANVPLFMSCSDKLAAWNVCGLQGSLLSSFVRPIYLYAVVVDEFCDRGEIA